MFNEIDTPAVLVDLDIAEANIAKFQDHCDAHGLKLRPHIKTHKLPMLAQAQVKAGAIGIIVINNDQQDEDACAEVDGQFGQHVAIPVIGVSYKSGERMRQTDDSIKVLVAETMAGKENECLDLSGERLCEDEVKKLSHKAGELHHVKEANFSDCNIFQWQWDCAGPGLLTAFFQELTHLQFLDLSGNILVNTDDEQQLALVIPELKQLKTLNISRASISAAELDEISCALGEHGGLTSLDVSVNPFFLGRVCERSIS
jgi:hypothetical protein